MTGAWPFLVLSGRGGVAAVALLTLVAGAAVGCSRDPQTGDGVPSTRVQDPFLPADGTTTTEFVAQCEAVDQGARDRIASGLTVEGASLEFGAAVRLPSRFADPPTVMRYVVAAELEGQGYEGAGDILVWLTSGITEDPEEVVAGNAAAEELSTWGDDISDGSAADRKRDAAMSTPDPRQAEGCVARSGLPPN